MNNPIVIPEHRVLGSDYKAGVEEVTGELKKVPITSTMGLKIVHYDGVTLQISAPLAPNINDKMTAFGGSLASVAFLTGWSWVVLMLRQHGALPADVVIVESNLKFIRAVRSGFFAEASMGNGLVTDLKDSESLQRFLRFYDKKGRAKVNLNVTVFDEGIYPVMSMEAVYAAESR